MQTGLTCGRTSAGHDSMAPWETPAKQAAEEVGYRYCTPTNVAGYS